ncbi:MAG: GAF domain-containing protein [Verrucomicrobia bacterium]|nr:GAF domain-containing protein [Verrucomicrobiota bacterium]
MSRRLGILLVGWIAAGGAMRTPAAEAAPTSEPIRERRITQYALRTWTARDGLAAPVRALAQTGDGYLWLGTDAGLYRFDGIRFVAITDLGGQALPATAVSVLRVTRDGALWMAFQTGALRRFHEGRLEARDLPRPNPAALVEDGTGALWAASPHGLWRRAPAGPGWERIGPDWNYPAPGAQTVWADGRGNVWVATDGFDFGLSPEAVRANTILRLPAGGRSFEATGESAGMVRAFAETPTGEMWWSDGNGTALRRLASPGVSAQRIGLAEAPSVLVADAAGTLWAGIWGFSLVRVPPGGSPEELGAADGLTKGHLLAGLCDRDGNVWIGTGTGLNRLSAGAVIPHTTREGLAPGTLLLAADPAGGVWGAGFGFELVQRLAPWRGAWEHLPRVRPDDSLRIVAARTGPGAVWFGGSFGLGRWAEGRLAVHPGLTLELGATVEAIAFAPDGGIWVTIWGADRRGRLERIPPDGPSTVVRRPGLPDDRCRVLQFDRQGRLWLGFETGALGCADLTGGYRAFGPAEGVPAGAVYGLFVEAAGALWVCGAGGLARLEGEAFRRVQLAHLLGPSVGAIGQDAAGNFWLTGALGIARIPAEEMERAVRVPEYRAVGRVFGELDGLRGMPVQALHPTMLARGVDGRLWFSTRDGVAEIDPAAPASSAEGRPPRVWLESVATEQATVALTGRPELAPSPAWLTLSYTAPSLTQPERVRFRFRLAGFESDWRGPTAEREVTYTRLPPGNYRFEVQATHGLGAEAWGERTSWAFRIRPAVHQTGWFQASAILGALALVAAAVRWRMLRMLRHNAELRREVEERQRAEEAMRAAELIARGQLETLAGSLEGLAREAEPGKFLEHVLDTICRQVGADSTGVWQVNEATGCVEFGGDCRAGRLILASAEEIRRAPRVIAPAQEHPVWTEFFRHGTHCVWGEIDTDEPRVRNLHSGNAAWHRWITHEYAETNVPALLQRLRAEGVVANLCVPMLVGGRVSGFLSLRFRVAHTVPPEQLQLLRALAHQAMLALQLTRLSQQSRSAAVAAERLRMAREVHDTLAQGATGVIMQLEAAEEALRQDQLFKMRDCLSRAKAASRESLGETRRLVQALRPLALEQGSLREALHALAERLTRETPLQATFRAAGDVQPLPGEGDDHLLKIAQEAVTNALRHARAARLQVRLNYAPQGVHLEVEDDGIGFDPAAASDGFGLQGMRERIESLGGRFGLRSAPGAGTTVRIEMPSPPAPAARS